MSCARSVYAHYDENDFVRYTVKDGLSDNQITAISQDHRGYLWVGTSYGLNRFDGYQFANYFQGLPEEFQVSSTIRKLKNLNPHLLAIITSNGFQIMNTSDGATHNYFINDSTAFTTVRNSVWDVSALPDGSFAVATSSGFYEITENGTLMFRHDAYNLKDIGKKRLFYGREIFPVAKNALLVYVEESEQVLYQKDQRVFRKVSQADPEWSMFSNPTEAEGGQWISRTKINDNEYLFLSQTDSIVYYNHANKKRVSSALPFHWVDEYSWESKATELNDSTFAINGGFSGFHLYHFDRYSGIITCHPHKFLSGHKVNALFQDRDRRLWVGTSAGLLRQTISPSRIERFHWDLQEKQNFGFVDAYIHQDQLYLGRYARSGGLVIVDLASMELIKEVTFYGENNSWNEVFSMEMYYPDTLWIGTFAGLLWFDTKSHNYGPVLDKSKNPPVPFELNRLEPERSDGFAWMLDWLDGNVVRYDIQGRTFMSMTMESQPPLPFAKVKSLAFDAYGDVWIGGHSLTRWNHHTMAFDTLISVYGGPNKFNDDIVTMNADEDGSLWLHNAENGLLEYRIRDKQFVAYGLSAGLPSTVFASMSPVYDNTLFIMTPHHLTRFDTRSHEFEIYGDEDDLPEVLSSSKRMYIDTVNHQGYAFYKHEVVRFPLDPVPTSYTTSDLFIQELNINNEQIIPYPKEGIRFRTAQNNLTLHYTVIDLEGASNFQFAYQINQSGNWTSAGDQRKLHLTNMPPGPYTLDLRATGNGGEQKMTTFSFSIAPPFWKTGWFVSLVVFVVAIIAYGIYRLRIAQISQKANLDKLLSQSEMQALRAQMNPHFVFNSLNSIREMILNNENAEASKYLSKFAHLIRVTLDQSHASFISLRETKDYLTRYIEMEKIRNAHFRFEMRADTGLDPDETFLPPMLIQPFIENAIWHGVNGNGKGIDIQVEFKRQEDQLVCTIDDNGIGIRKALEVKKHSEENGHQSVGISNIQHRIDLLNKKYHQQSSVIIQDKVHLDNHDTTGTIVTITLPLDMNNES